MNAEAIKKAFRRKPFTGIEVSLSSGEVFLCPSPEVFVSEEWFVTVDEKGETQLIDPSAIVRLRSLPRRTKGSSSSDPKR